MGEARSHIYELRSEIPDRDGCEYVAHTAPTCEAALAETKQDFTSRPANGADIVT